MELSYKVFNFTEDQDLKLKIGYNAFKQVSVVMYSLLLHLFSSAGHFTHVMNVFGTVCCSLF